MKISVITNGISGNYEEACRIMNDTGVRYAEIQHLDGVQIEHLAIGEKRSVPGFPVETLCLEEASKVKDISEKYEIIPICITTHVFNGISVKSTEIGDDIYCKHIEMLNNAIAFAKIVGAGLVRVMCFTKQPVIFGYHGAREWLANDNKIWDKFISLYKPVIEIAEKENINIVIENGNGMICSSYLMRKMVDDLQSNRIKYLWDPANALYYNEQPTLETYRLIRDILGHVHIKDLIIDIPSATMDIKKIGTGQLGPFLADLSNAMREDCYDGFISLENIYKPDGGTTLDGYYIDIIELKKIFE